MNSRILLTVLIAGVFIMGSLASNEAFGAVDMFMKIKGVEGESKDDTHRGEIEIESWSWGETNSGASHGSGGGAGKVSMQDFSFTMEYEKASPKLMQACADGTHFEDVTLILRKAGSEAPIEYLTITMSDVLVSSYQTGISDSAEQTVPFDSVSLNYGAIKFEYKPQESDGDPDPPVITGYAAKPGHRGI